PVGERLHAPRAVDAEGPGERQRLVGDAGDVDLGAAGEGERGHEEADGPRPDHEEARPGPERRRVDGPQRPAPRPAARTARPVDGIGQRVQGPRRHWKFFGEGAGPAAPDADLESILADMAEPGPAPPAVPAPEHGVSRHPPSDPGAIDA